MAAKWPPGIAATLRQEVGSAQDGGFRYRYGDDWLTLEDWGDWQLGHNPGYDVLTDPSTGHAILGVGGLIWQAEASRLTVGKHFRVVEMDDPAEATLVGEYGASCDLASVSGTPGDVNDFLVIGWDPVTVTFNGGELGDDAGTSAIPPASVYPAGARVYDSFSNVVGWVYWGALPVGADPLAVDVAPGTVDQRTFGSPNHTLAQVTSHHCTIAGFGLAGATVPDPALTSVTLGTATSYVIFYEDSSQPRLGQVTLVTNSRGGLLKEGNATVIRVSAVTETADEAGYMPGALTDSGTVVLNVGDRLFTRLYIRLWQGGTTRRARLAMTVNPYPIQGHYPVGGQADQIAGSFRVRGMKRLSTAHRNSKAIDETGDYVALGGNPTGDHTDLSSPSEAWISTVPPGFTGAQKRVYVRDSGGLDPLCGLGFGQKRSLTNPGSFPVLQSGNAGTRTRLEITTSVGQTTVIKRIVPDYEGQLIRIKAIDARTSIAHLNTDNPELTGGATTGQFRLPNSVTYALAALESFVFINNSGTWEVVGRSDPGAETVATSAARYRPVLNVPQTRFNAATITSAATWPLGTSANAGAFTGTNVSFALVYLTAADYEIGSLTAKLRLVAGCLVNATSPGITFTVGLYAVGTPDGGLNVLNPQIVGSAVSGSTVALSPTTGAPAAPSNSGDFTFPASGWYILAVATSGPMTANSRVDISARLEVRNV